jgi:hypothetical protein
MPLIGTRTNDVTRLVSLEPSGLLHHALVVGQSGSGKSFFVARLIEEIVLNTAARVIIIDPNGDFRSIATPSPTAFTTHSSQFATVLHKRDPELDEPTTFSKAWSERRFLHLYPNTPVLPPDRPMALNRRLVIHWELLEEEDRDFLIRFGRELRGQVQTGIEVCVAYAQFLNEKYGSPFTTDLRGLVKAADEFAGRNVSLLHYPHVKDLTTEDWSNVRATIADVLQRHTVWSSGSVESTEPRPVGLAEFIDGPFQSVAPSSHLYWDVLSLALDASRVSDSLLIVDTVLARLWRNAKTAWRRATNPTLVGHDPRVPTFVVIDEAQNFAPTETTNPLRQRVTERLLQIAAEGRKYGIYLILATQRPTKLHPALVPECENSCVLRVQSSLDIRFAIDTLGIEEKLARNCPSFKKGQGLVSGRWLDSDVGIDSQFVPARSSVGGGGLPDSWLARTSPSVPFALEDPLITIREVVVAELSAATTPITLVELAEVVRTECSNVVRDGWLGRETFKSLLLDLGIEELAFSLVGPGYAYLKNVQQPPTESPKVELPIDLRAPLIELHRQKNLPLLESETFATLLVTLSEVVQESVFNMSEIAKAVRDLMLKGGIRVGRGSIDFVIRAILFSGHRFDPDLPQEAPILAAALVRSIVKDLQITVPLEGDALVRALAFCCGGLLDADMIRRQLAQLAPSLIVESVLNPSSDVKLSESRDALQSNEDIPTHVVMHPAIVEDGR